LFPRRDLFGCRLSSGVQGGLYTNLGGWQRGKIELQSEIVNLEKLEKMTRHISPEYLRRGASIVKEMSMGSRVTRRTMWNFLVVNVGVLERSEEPVLRMVLGRSMYERGCVGFSSYSEVDIPAEIKEKLNCSDVPSIRQIN